MAPPQRKKVCYVVLTARSLVWFLLTIFATMLIMISLFTPHWLISPNPSEITTGNLTVSRYPSFGLSSRCKKLSSGIFECSSFSLQTSTEVFPFFWKLAYLLMVLGFLLLSLTCIFTFLSFCRQSFFGKSMHTVTGSIQILSGIFAMVATFSYAFGWSADRIAAVCIEISSFHPGDCELGYSFYSSIVGIIISMLCGLLSLKAEKASMNPTIKRRIEEGNERLVFAP